ncbi:HDOD domain-containing protein [Undibacterium umbellatum]|uniref:HDOD domain-containing protein n=1 Tax=Undibacterium umbellatum TaxID=2762300 RepID=A0ABR6ZAE8_9BURK|nr:HDOD domain-containing protein [Undibacterium umbellatum]MBC3908727.1 HDOD domain-containing protein [Undibacterium umbellatum]
MTDNAEFKIHLDDMVKKIKDLPTLPEVAMEMLQNLEDEESSLDMVTEKIAMDHSITAKLLRLANSSYYGNNSKVVTLQQATAMLGIKNVKNLIRVTTLANKFPTANCPGFNFKAFWRHSIATAVCAEQISRTLHMKHDFAFTAGLLHDLGRLVLVTCYPANYDEVLRYQAYTDADLLVAERSIMHIDHVDAGLALATHWNFSEAVCDAIRGHHHPEQENLHVLASVVHIANAIVHALDLSHDENDRLPLLSQSAWDTLGLGEADYLSIFHETEMRFDALDQIVL